MSIRTQTCTDTGSRRVAILCQRLPPEVCGVGDYTANVARASIGSDCVVTLLSRTASPTSIVAERKVNTALLPLNPISLAFALRGFSTIIVNFTPRSYSRFGTPIAIGVGLAIARICFNTEYIVVAHELWGRVKWPPYRRLHQFASRLFTLGILKNAQRILVLTEENFETLSKSLPVTRLEYTSIPSNITTTITPTKWGSRTPGSWIIFGLAHSRYWTLLAAKDLLPKLISMGHLRRLVLVGPRDEKYSPQEDSQLSELRQNCDVIQTGEIPLDDVALCLNASQFFLTGQHPTNLPKSGSFMAAIQAGCVVVSAKFDSAPVPKQFHGLVLNPTKLLDPFSTDFDLDLTSQAGREWYSKNRSWNTHFRQLIAKSEV